MCSASTEGQAADRRLVIETLGNRSNKNLIQSGFAVMQMAARQTVVVLEVDWCREFRGEHFLLKSGRVA